MAKRLTDTEKWKKAWFRRLSPIHKVFWEYLRDNCDHAGVWQVDFELAQFQINGVLQQDNLFETFKNHIIIINSNKWFLIDFIPFQYSCTIEQLNPKNKLHKSVLALLEKHKIDKGLASSLEGVKNKVKNKDKEGKGLPSPLVGAKDKNKASIKKEIVSDGGLPYDKIVPFFQEDDFLSAWYEHTKVRKSKKGSPSQRADRHILRELMSLSKGDKNLAILLLDQSARKGWIDVFPLKEKPKIKNSSEVDHYVYYCYHCNSNYKRNKLDNYRCKRNDCKVEVRGTIEDKNYGEIGAKLEHVDTVYKEES